MTKDFGSRGKRLCTYGWYSCHLNTWALGFNIRFSNVFGFSINLLCFDFYVEFWRARR